MGDNGITICESIGLSLMLIAGLLALRERSRSLSTLRPIAAPDVSIPSISASVGDFVLDRDRYVPGQMRYGSFEVRVVNPIAAVAQKMRGVVFSNSHGSYFVTEVSTAARLPFDSPLRLKAQGPIDQDKLAQLITMEYGRDGELLLDRLRRHGRSFVAIIFQDENRRTFVVRTHFRLDGSDEQLQASGFQQPQIFTAINEDPALYEQHVRPVTRTFWDRIIDGWNSLSVVTTAETVVRIVAALVAFLVVIFSIVLSNQKDLLKSQTGWRSISQFEQRLITEYLRPLAGQEITIVAPLADTDPEAHSYGRLLQSIFSKAGWKTELRAPAPWATKANLPLGLGFVATDLEHPAVKPLQRAFAKAAINLPEGLGPGYPTGDSTIILGLLVGTSPNAS